MFIRRVRDCTEFVAGDDTRLREIFNPLKDAIDLRYSYAIARVSPGRKSSLHRLRHSEVYHILSGRGEVRIDDERGAIEAGDVVYIPPGAVQNIACVGDVDLVFVCIVDPAWKAEDEEVLE